ncbi:MAG: hypothetical protein DI551_05655 [Micavibrio aeruginosavorus]|uniref:Tail fiber protein n=1 Tax=Micavibrio aeruginosavorus TaxID=349221 RepID=A0A2W5MZD7_9BACT|nr:MAG: hypothetical protein DI551_05655 [Micavibrio aeruginosavorus]
MISYADRVLETTNTVGTGPISLAGAPTGFQTFVSGVGSGKQVSYHIDNGTDWETGVGTIMAGTPDTLTRDPRSSSNGGAAVNWGGGTKNVRLIYPSGLAVSKDENGNFLSCSEGTAGGTANAHTFTPAQETKALSDNMRVRYRAPAANTSAVTLNYDSKGVKTIKFNGQDIVSGMIQTGDMLDLIYKSSSNIFELQNDPSSKTSAQNTLASAATVSLAAQGSSNIIISGTTGITSFGTSGRTGTIYRLRFTGALTLTNSASLSLPGGRDYTTVANDVLEVEDLGSNNWLVRSWTVLQETQATTSGTNFDFAIPAGTKAFDVIQNNTSLSGTDDFLHQIGDSGGISATGYSSLTGADTNVVAGTTGFITSGNAAATAMTSVATFRNAGGNNWIAAGVNKIGSARINMMAGSKTLSNPITTYRLTRTGSNTFDAGSVTVICYR